MPDVVMRENLKLAWKGHQVVDMVPWTKDIRRPFRHHQVVLAPSTALSGYLKREKYLRPMNRL